MAPESAWGARGISLVAVLVALCGGGCRSAAPELGASRFVLLGAQVGGGAVGGEWEYVLLDDGVSVGGWEIFVSAGSGSTVVRERTRLRVAGGGLEGEVRVWHEQLLAPDGVLVSSAWTVESGGVAQEGRATIGAGAIVVRTEGESRTIALGASMPESRLGLLGRASVARVGSEVRGVVFDPLAIAVRAVRVKVGALEQVPGAAVAGRRLEVFEAGRVSTWWVDEVGLPLRVDRTAGPGALRSDLDAPADEGRTVAAGVVDVAAHGRVSVGPGVVFDASAPRASYRLSGLRGELAELGGGRQTVTGGVVRVMRDPSAGFLRIDEVARGDQEWIELMRPALAEPLVPVPEEAMVRAAVEVTLRALRGRVRPARVIGRGSAADTLVAGRGDCTEQADALAAALRAVGIPSRVAVGVAALEGAPRHHAWVEYWDAGWRTVDPALDQLPADVTHVRLAAGSTSAVLDEVGLHLGTLVIEAPR